jgi:hypothetical protein
MGVDEIIPSAFVCFSYDVVSCYTHVQTINDQKLLSGGTNRVLVYSMIAFDLAFQQVRI